MSTTPEQTTLKVEQAAHLLRTLSQLENHLSTMATERFSPAFHEELAKAESLVLTIAMRIANLADGFENLDLLVVWKAQNIANYPGKVTP